MKITDVEINKIISAIDCAGLRLEVLEMYKENKSKSTKDTQELLVEAKKILKQILINAELMKTNFCKGGCGRTTLFSFCGSEECRDDYYRNKKI